MQCPMFAEGVKSIITQTLYSTVLSKSPGGPEALLLCYAHPTGLVTLLRYFGFIVSDCMFNSMSVFAEGVQSVISQLFCIYLQISRRPGMIPSMLSTS